MSIPEPHPSNYNTAREVRRDVDEQVNFHIGLYDIDLALNDYMNDVIAPTVKDIDGTAIKVPVIYGSPERWASARKFGFVRDQKGQIQLPLVMFKRTTVARSGEWGIGHGAINRFQNRSFVAHYTKKNKYDKFAVMNGVKPTVASYNVITPDHVTLTYDCMAWTSYTEHLNSIIEMFTFADEDYWGDKLKFKFRTSINSFNISTELTQNRERVIRASFNLVVQARLLPESFANKMTTKKSFTPKRLLLMTEIETDNTDIKSDEAYLGINTEQSVLSQLQPVFDFLAISNQYTGTFVSSDSGRNAVFDFENTEILPTPPEVTDLAEHEKFIVTINGVLISQDAYTIENAAKPTDTNVTITFDQGLLGYDLDNTDEIVIKGKITYLGDPLVTSLLGRPTTSVTTISDYQYIIDFLSLTNTFTGTFVSNIVSVNSIWKFTNTELIETPASLPIDIVESDKYQVFLNGIETSTSGYTLIESGTDVQLTFDVAALGFDVDASDTVLIIGKIRSI